MVLALQSSVAELERNAKDREALDKEWEELNKVREACDKEQAAAEEMRAGYVALTELWRSKIDTIRSMVQED